MLFLQQTFHKTEMSLLQVDEFESTKLTKFTTCTFQR